MLKVIKKTEQSMTRKPSSESTVSSDSESESGDSNHYLTDIIRDYSSESENLIGRFQKRVSKQLKDSGVHPLSMNLVEYSTMYRQLAQEYLEKFTTGSASTFAINRMRYLFCVGAQHSMRIGNSSSVLERSFSDSVRSSAGRRVRTRNNLINDF